MHTIRLENLRCFRKVSARLAALALLVGGNNTGKTDFMAIIRAMRQTAYEYRVPDFNEAPYDLGDFEQIVHNSRIPQPDTFKAGFDVSGKDGEQSTSIDFVFGKGYRRIRNTPPIPVTQRTARGKTWREDTTKPSGEHSLKAGTSNGSWNVEYPRYPSYKEDSTDRRIIIEYAALADTNYVKATPIDGSPAITEEDIHLIRRLLPSPEYMISDWKGVFANAPSRPKPQRIYDLAPIRDDTEWGYFPMLLSRIARLKGDDHIKKELENFGSEAGLFDEIIVKRRPPQHRELLDSHSSGRDQLQIYFRMTTFKALSNGDKIPLTAPMRNLADMGYGVSQVLPIITELLSDNEYPMFLLQNPETNLHPMAQAALGSLFCRVASPERQVIVETHSDHLIDRVTLDVRDSVTSLRPEDVSILYFEREGSEVNVHSIRTDEEGNILDAPRSYRRFFMQEMERTLGSRRIPSKT